MIKAIIFDLDGTLYPEADFVRSGFRAVSDYVSKKYNIDSQKVFDILDKDFEAGMRNTNFDVLLSKIGVNENIKNLIKIYRKHLPKINIFPDALKFLESNKKSLILGLITNGDKKTQKNKISALNIKKYFRVIFIATEFGNDDWEGSLKSFKQVLKKLKTKPKETIYVGDNPLRDFMGARKLGLVTIRTKRGGNENIMSNINNKPDYEILDLSGLEKIIKNINGK